MSRAVWVRREGAGSFLFSPQAEKVFMVARGLVREAQEQLEVQQAKLKEVRHRLDRISREDSQYLELATLEHRMLQVGPRGALPHLGRAQQAGQGGARWESGWSDGQAWAGVNQKLPGGAGPQAAQPIAHVLPGHWVDVPGTCSGPRLPRRGHQRVPDTPLW